MAAERAPVSERSRAARIDPRVEVEEPASVEPAPRFPKCPRCGGDGKPPKRRTKNPFLEDHVTCVDCGLEFEPTNVWPW